MSVLVTFQHAYSTYSLLFAPYRPLKNLAKAVAESSQDTSNTREASWPDPNVAQKKQIANLWQQISILQCVLCFQCKYELVCAF